MNGIKKAYIKWSISHKELNLPFAVTWMELEGTMLNEEKKLILHDFKYGI